MLKSTKEIFIQNLKRLRKERFRNQELFASKVGLSERGYQKYEQGETDPIPEIIDRFAKELGCKPSDLLLDGTKPTHPALEYASVFRALADEGPIRIYASLFLLTKDPEYLERLRNLGLSPILPALEKLHKAL